MFIYSGNFCIFAIERYDPLRRVHHKMTIIPMERKREVGGSPISLGIFLMYENGIFRETKKHDDGQGF